jgi:alkanesulfonate monooxygenase SsuD/methylene tetrahydromethanopterin reductase-like flavin-dependent oxidoreductase (luciferase family)
VVTVTNLPSRPAPVLARTITSLSGGRIVLGIGAGAIWDMIEKLGVPRLSGGAAVRAMAEAITLIRALSGSRPTASASRISEFDTCLPRPLGRRVLRSQLVPGLKASMLAVRDAARSSVS